MIEKCPKCGKYTFHIEPKVYATEVIQMGTCSNCGYVEEIDDDKWFMRYDTAVKMFRARLMEFKNERRKLIEELELNKPGNKSAKYLLTPEVLSIIEKEDPDIYKLLVEANPTLLKNNAKRL